MPSSNQGQYTNSEKKLLPTHLPTYLPTLFLKGGSAEGKHTYFYMWPHIAFCQLWVSQSETTICNAIQKKRGCTPLIYKLPLDISTEFHRICTFVHRNLLFYLFLFHINFWDLLERFSNVIQRGVHISNKQLFMDHSTEVFARKNFH